MWRFAKERNTEGELEEKVHGVLTDYDLSSWTDSMDPDYSKTSLQQTGTPPYMAHEILKGTNHLHLYRHDVESLFNIMLLMSARHTIGIPEGEKERRVVMRKSATLPYEDWFNEPRYHMLGSLKGTFFSDMEPIELSPAFEDFRGWLRGLQFCFSKGFKLKPSAVEEPEPEWVKNKAGGSTGQVKPHNPDPFIDETLGGYVDYPTIIQPIPHLEGELKGLIIRYKPSASDVVQADA